MPALPVALVCGWLAVAGTNAAPANPPDAFLDQPLPPGYVPHSPQPPENPNVKWSPDMVSYLSYQERLSTLKKLTPRRLVLPEGFEALIADGDRTSYWDGGGDVLFLNERNGVSYEGNTYRTFMTWSLGCLGLTMTYNPASDTLMTDFPWRRNDPRNAKELVDYLTKYKAPSYQSLLDMRLVEKASSGNQSKGICDPWLDAFDALLNKPENFSCVWRLRFLDDHRRFFDEPYTINLLAHHMHDEKGGKHVLFVNDEPEYVIPGEGYIAYYLFDPNGKFEKGGILRSGHRCVNTSVKLNDAATELTMRGLFNASHEVDTRFVLTDHGLIIKNQDTLSAGLGVGKLVYLIHSPGS